MKMLFVILATMISASAWADNAEQFAPLTESTLADGREIVTTAAGLSVYVFDEDEGNVSVCYKACAKAWPPLLVASAEGLGASMGVTTRDDGTLQLTVNGKPVYLFVGDGQPGDINGDGLQGVWHLIID